jgi:hypothetical protein
VAAAGPESQAVAPAGRAPVVVKLGGEVVGDARLRAIAEDLALLVAGGERVVVATNTISLQEQLIETDIPLLNAVIPEAFSAVLVKGRGNYVSLRRLKLASEREARLYDALRTYTRDLGVATSQGPAAPALQTRGLPPPGGFSGSSPRLCHMP